MEYTVAAVQEALGLLMLVAQEPGHGVTQLAKRSGNTKARAYRLLTTLEQCGFVQREGDNATYSLGHLALVLGLAAQEQVSLVRMATPHLERLGARFNENVYVRVRDGLESVCVARWESSHAVHVNAPIGQRRPIYGGASGKLLLAHASEELQQAVLGTNLDKLTPGTVMSKSKLQKELGKIRQQGYAFSDGELAQGVVALAAPIHDSSGAVVAALGMSIPSTRLPSSFDDHIEAMKSAADALSTELGWSAARRRAA